MCLYIDREIHGPLKRIKKAKENIVCYKILRVHCGNLFTPYTADEVPSQIYKGEMPMVGEPLKSRRFFRRIFHDDLIEEGYIHTFRVKQGAYSAAEWFAKDGTKIRIFECIIPKGTYYYQGTERDYASEQIVYKQELTE
jgi:hypothetical protein